MATYRNLSPEEIPNAVRLWVDVFGVEAAFFESLLAAADPDDFSVGAFERDKLVSSVHVFMRWLRDGNGQPIKVGGIGSVSTLPEARNQGHSAKLLQMSLTEMEVRDCVWSGLGTGVNDHYARQGWRTISIPSFKGTLRRDLTGAPIEAVTVDDSLLSSMAIIHEAYSANRPLFNARSTAMWQESVRYRTTQSYDSVHVVSTGGSVVAYLVSRIHQDNIVLVEAACLPGTESELADLVRNRLAQASQQGCTTARYELPEDSGVLEAFKESCQAFWSTEDRSWMARPIADRISWPDLLTLHANPRARRSDLDHF